LRHEHGLNPALGLRAIRWSLAEPGMFRQQLRAILRASAYGKVRILFPMVAHLGEIRLIFEALARARQQFDEAGKAYNQVEVGAMIEVPAAAIMIDRFLEHFDFVSIGTNDLIQYTLAIDRADEAVAHLYDPWHPAVLRLLNQTISSANRAHGLGVRLWRDGGGPGVHRAAAGDGAAQLLHASSAHLGDQAARASRRHPGTRRKAAGSAGRRQPRASDVARRRCLAGTVRDERKNSCQDRKSRAIVTGSARRAGPLRKKPAHEKLEKPSA
jgi:hypothetical protein